MAHQDETPEIIESGPVDKGQVFRCQGCQELFRSTNTRSDSVAEYEIKTGTEYSTKNTLNLCDGCYEKYMAWRKRMKL